MTTELFEAIAAGDAATVERVTAADPAAAGAANADGVPAIVWACYVGKPDLAELLAARRGVLTVAEAAVLGRTDDVRARLDAGAGVDDLTRDGFAALHYAAFFGHGELAGLLIARGATIDLRAKNEMKVTALHSAAAAGHRGVALLLIDAGADVNAAQRHGWTALHAAAEHGDDVLAAALLAKGADPAARGDDGTTAAELAAAGGHRQLAELLSRPVHEA
ncbi:MAG: uncharacterized protein QOG49_1640 [Frankiaceae bacterium]|jgi:ankyrin repeat protein|nr:uncharacterized protein [Frankiaceae bacterium]